MTRSMPVTLLTRALPVFAMFVLAACGGGSGSENGQAHGSRIMAGRDRFPSPPVWSRRFLLPYPE